RQQKKDEIDRAPVNRFVGHGLRQPGEQAIDAPQPVDLAVWNRHALAEAGRAQLLALAQAAEDRRRVLADSLSRQVRELLKERALAAARKGRLDRVEIEKVGKLHRMHSLRAAHIRLAALIRKTDGRDAAHPSRYSRLPGDRSC